MLDSVFIYGSLSAGMVHFDRIAAHVQEEREAYVLGCAYRLPVGYPVYLNHGYTQVPGTWIRLSQSEILITLLDEFHGVSHLDPGAGLFTRQESDVFTRDGEILRSYVYALNPARLPKGAKLIEGGDWKRSLEEVPPLPKRLTEKQKSYLRRLATTSGREIVPIDLTLYRELVHLDLVVDKGRRLALTSLGQEVARYI